MNNIEQLYRDKLLRVFEEFISICKGNNLKYYAAFGTVIGAVRHHGLIPWDDDIDVMMPRPDYEKFIAICQTSNIGEYELVTPTNTENYYLTFSKFCDCNSTIAERKKSKCVFGVFIDIFPIDGAPNNLDDCSDLVRRFNQKKNELSWVSNNERIIDFIYLLITFKFKRFFKSCMYLINRGKYRKSIVESLNRICTYYNYEACDYCIVYAEEGINGIFPKSWLGDGYILPFEAYNVTVPLSYDKYLSHLYGDYMKLPPKDERVSHHLKAMYFLDIEKRVEKSNIWNKSNSNTQLM